MFLSTSGNVTSDFTLGSQVWLSTAPATASPFTSGCSFDQRAASTISSGYVEAMKICASKASGYNAIGARICSSSSFLKGGVRFSGAAAAGAGAGLAGPWALAQGPAASSVMTKDPQIAIARFIFPTSHGPYIGTSAAFGDSGVHARSDAMVQSA